MADQNTQNPFPLLGRIPAGAIRDSLQLLWNQLGKVTTALGPVLTAPGGGASILTAATSDRVHVAASVSIADTTPTNIVWGNDGSVVMGPDKAELFSAAANPTRITIPRRFSSGGLSSPSLWVVSLNATWDASAVGIRQILLNLVTPAGTTALASAIQDAASALPTSQSVSAQVFNPQGGAYLQAAVFQTSGGALPIAATIDVTQVF